MPQNFKEMIFKTGCKINLGLQVLSKREDGYHNISTIFYPIDGINDLVEIVPSDTDSFSSSGIVVQCPEEKNLCMIALKCMREHYKFPGCKIHLHKLIPFGAGLGGGSANAMGVIEGLNALFSLGMSTEDKITIGAKIGSDVPFFAINRPQIASGRGEILRDSNISLKGMYIQIAKPDESVSTREAYEGIALSNRKDSIEENSQLPIECWEKLLKNDFEPSVLSKLPKSKALKDFFHRNGAVYSALSGSGSSVFGIYYDKPVAKPDYIILEQQLDK